MCGEKASAPGVATPSTGSPPRMRGKGVVHVFVPEKFGITPAHAGKRLPVFSGYIRSQDHPRTCGEKMHMLLCVPAAYGSPPHMRGKGPFVLPPTLTGGITPAPAGKSSRPPDGAGTCLGSPPHMRGKAILSPCPDPPGRITPAHAGKRRSRTRTPRPSPDHPRVCGEKLYYLIYIDSNTGSPPRMRGKAQHERAGNQ